LAGAFKEGSVTGQFRAYYINKSYSYTTGPEYTRDGLAVGGKMGFITAPVDGITFGTLFYSTNKVDSTSSMSQRNDATLFGSQDQGYTYIGELYINYKNKNTVVKVGRQRLDTPLVGSDDGSRFLPNLFEAAIIKNSDITDTSITIGQITKIAYGTLSSGFGPSANNPSSPPAFLGTQALAYGYGAIYNPANKTNLYHGFAAQTDYNNGNFISMSQGAFGPYVSDEGLTVGSVEYRGLANTKLQIWDYYLPDFFNTVYAQGDFMWKCLLNPNINMTASAQIMQQKGIGAEEIGSVDSLYYGGQLKLDYNDFLIKGAYSVTGSDTNAVNNGGVITPWGGMNSFTYTQSTRHQYLADTKSFKFTSGYNFKNRFGIDLDTSIYYAQYDIGRNNDFDLGHSWNASETGIDVIHNVEAIKNLQLWGRINCQRNFWPASGNVQAVNNNEYRLEANYNF